jgi:hypothetical protein
MFEQEDLKVLLGNSIEEPEVDYDDAEVASELGHPVEEEALMEYFYITITHNIGRLDFQEEYLSVYPEVMRYPTEKKQLLAESILKQIKQVYDFIPSKNVDTNSEIEIDNVLKLIEFIEYNHVDFIIDVWTFLNPETNSFQVEKYCEQNTLNIISEIEEQLSSREFPWMIADFLRTYNKEDITAWFCEKSKRLRSSILLKLI